MFATTLGRVARRTVLTVHIVASVGLLGDCAAILVMHVFAQTTDDPAARAATYELLTLFSAVFGIPLSFASLVTGLVLGMGTKWGVLTHRWVVLKLAAIVGVILAGAVVLGPATAAMLDDPGAGREPLLVAVCTFDVVVLLAATGLSVFKPRLGGGTRVTTPRAKLRASPS